VTPRINKSDIFYGLRHPMQAWRYLQYRDIIPYETCARYLPANPVIVEAGAYDGSNTRDFCRFWPACQVYAFEPVPSAYERLLKVAAEFDDRIHPQKMALGRRTETSEMHVSMTGPSGGEQSSSLLAPAATREEFPFVDFRNETIAVEVTRLDAWAAERNVNRVDFLWLDLQGMELAALEGCGELLATVGAIHCEVQNLPLYAGAPLYPEVSDFLKRQGFRVGKEAVFRRGGNMLFVRAN
jgi:FkbM family methyltransferase